MQADAASGGFLSAYEHFTPCEFLRPRNKSRGSASAAKVNADPAGRDKFGHGKSVAYEQVIIDVLHLDIIENDVLASVFLEPKITIALDIGL